MPEGADDWIDEFRSVPQLKSNFSGCFAVFQEDEEILKMPLFSSYQTYEKGNDAQHNFAPDLDRGDLLGIVLDRCEDISNLKSIECIFILVVHNKG